MNTNLIVYKIALIQLLMLALWVIALGTAYIYKLKRDRWYVPSDNERMDREGSPIPWVYWIFMIIGTVAAAFFAGYLFNYVGNNAFLAG